MGCEFKLCFFCRDDLEFAENLDEYDTELHPGEFTSDTAARTDTEGLEGWFRARGNILRCEPMGRNKK